MEPVYLIKENTNEAFSTNKGATFTMPDSGKRYMSVMVINKAGFLQKNEYGAYSVNNIAGTPNADGSFTVHFGGDPKSINYLPITEGWNYTVRLDQPHQEILDGAWTFPAADAVVR